MLLSPAASFSLVFFAGGDAFANGEVLVPVAKAPKADPLKLNAELAAPFWSDLFGVDGVALPIVPNAEVLPNAGFGADGDQVEPKPDTLPKARLGAAPGLVCGLEAGCGAMLNAGAGSAPGLLGSGRFEKAPKPKPGVDLNEPKADAADEEGSNLLGAKLKAEAVAGVEVETDFSVAEAGLSSLLAEGVCGLGG